MREESPESKFATAIAWAMVAAGVGGVIGVVGAMLLDGLGLLF